MKIIVGLGNPGEKYEGTRHNTGRMAVQLFAKKHDFSDWRFDKKINVQICEGKIGKEKVTLVTPDTFMNNSGKALAYLVKSKKAALETLVVYDDLDLPIGTMKLSFGRSSGGHNGLESIIRVVHTKDFPRIRIGVSPATPGGKIRKPAGDEAVLKFLLGRFSDKEFEAIKKTFKKAGEAMEVSVTDGYQMAMNQFN
jgi:PTH1 family peptidyl-tRNA hydrolase